MLLPCETGVGVPVAVTAVLAWPDVATTVEVVAVLFEGFESGVSELTLAVAVITVPEGVAAGTFSTTTGKFATAPAVTEDAVQLTVPVPPTAGTAQLQPGGVTSD